MTGWTPLTLSLLTPSTQTLTVRQLEFNIKLENYAYYFHFHQKY